MTTSKDFTIVKRVLDKYYDFMGEIEGNCYETESIPPSMIDKSKKSKYENTSFWIAIPSTVTEKNLNELESFLKHKLPDSFKYFLQLRHFLQLSLGGYGIGFFCNLPELLNAKFKEIINEQFGTLLNRNYLPFANFMDFGVLCFDANKIKDDNNYPIVLFSNEDGYSTPKFYAVDFLGMFKEFETNLDDWIKNNREIRKEN